MFFEDWELECHCPRCKGQGTASKVADILKARLEELRQRWGKPINVSCAYRCPEHNLEVGGVNGSQHTQGLAADVFITGSYEEFCKFAQFVIDSKLFDGVGVYLSDEFVHVDVRDGGLWPNEYRWTA